jgi:hypothetical protein
VKCNIIEMTTIQIIFCCNFNTLHQQKNNCNSGDVSQMFEVCEEQPENVSAKDPRFHFESSLRHAEQGSEFQTSFMLYLFD